MLDHWKPNQIQDHSCKDKSNILFVFHFMVYSHCSNMLYFLLPIIPSTLSSRLSFFAGGRVFCLCRFNSFHSTAMAIIAQCPPPLFSGLPRESKANGCGGGCSEIYELCKIPTILIGPNVPIGLWFTIIRIDPKIYFYIVSCSDTLKI